MQEAYHFIGIGGIGMSALARILLEKGAKVRGSDRSFSFLLNQLAQEGAEIQVGHSAQFLEKGTTVVYTSGLSEDNEEWIFAKTLGLPILHRSDLLNLLCKGKQPLLVTGSHGKTTTSSLLACVLSEAKLDPSLVVGGIVRSLGTNGKFGRGSFFVAEADESDGSFLKTPSFGAIVTNLSNDHLDYWKTGENLEAGFQKFFSQVQNQDLLFWCGDDERLRKLLPGGTSYGFSKQNNLQIVNFQQTRDGVLFDLLFEEKLYRQIALRLFGRHNALNAAAVFGLALRLEIREESIRQTFANFQGAGRRMEYKGEAHKIQVFDDYGHHPKEIRATLQALREHIREKRMVVVFQPHRYTRVRDLFEEFGSCFVDADLVVLTDIYSAGEAPIEGVNSAKLYARLQESLGSKVCFIPRANLEKQIIDHLCLHDVVLTIGAGDITESGEKILQNWLQRSEKMRVAVLCGGISEEHRVSLQSAKNIAQGLDPAVYETLYFGVTKLGAWLTGIEAIERLIRGEEVFESKPISTSVFDALTDCDVCIPVFHGPQGEDGMMQGFLDTLQIPYAGCDYRASVLCMDKIWTKQIALMHGIPTAPFFSLSLREYRSDPQLILNLISQRLQYPIWIKPVHLGSSLGVGRASSPDEAVHQAEIAFSYDDQVVIEQHIEGKQIEFGILGNEYLRVGSSCEILNKGAFVDYADKYGPNAMPYAIPARITSIQEKLGIELAKQVYLAAKCKGLARVDFFLDENGYYWLNEINSFPGCTDTSAFPKIWASVNVSMSEICDDLIVCALHKDRQQARIYREELWRTGR